MKSLTEFFELVKAKIATESPSTSVVFGREHLYRRDNQATGTANRVVMAPGDPGGEHGEFAPPRHVHVLEKPDRYIDKRLVTVQVWGYDSTKPSDQMLQDDALNGLLQCVGRSLQYVVRSQGHLNGFYQARRTYPIPPRDRRHGDMCQIVFWVGFNVRDVEPASVVNDAVVDPVTQQSSTVSFEIIEEVTYGS